MAKKQQKTDDVVTDIVKQKKHRNRPDLQKFGEENIQPGDNARYLRYAMVAMDLPPIDISDPKQVEQRIKDYFSFCVEHDRKPNIKGLGNWIGVSDETVRNWRKGVYREGPHLEVIRKAVSMLEEMWWDYGYDGKVNPANWIFIGKNAYGMKDVQDVVVTPNQPLGEMQNESELQKRIEQAVVIDAEED